MKNLSFKNRLGFAVTGIRNAFRREASFRIQSAAAGFLVLFCLIQRPSPVWCALFTAMVSLVFVLELINTALEALIDKLHPAFDPDIGFTKDCLAGAVLIASLGSVVVFVFYCLTHITI